MIIIGYQGIGKSSLAKGGNGFIDLESGNFWVSHYRDGKMVDLRDPHWEEVYANMAVHLHQQGYNVFTSSHRIVRNCLKKHKELNENGNLQSNVLAVVYPVLSLRDQWVEKLRQRYETTQLTKDYKAWKNAEEMYLENIQDLSDEPLPIIHIPLTTIDYCLEDELARRSILRT